MGNEAIAPLPEPPPAVQPSAIESGSWRGRGWVSARLLFAGSITGDAPARSSLTAIGGGAEGGWRVRPWFGLGMGFSRAPHQVAQLIFDDGTSQLNRGYLAPWDLAFLRFWAPLDGRLQPYIDLGGGVAFLDPARTTATLAGWTARTNLGLDIWVGPAATIGFSGQYRVVGVDQSIGHGWQAGVDLGFHW